MNNLIDDEIYQKKFNDLLNKYQNHKENNKNDSNKLNLIISSKFLFEQFILQLYDYKDKNGLEHYTKVRDIIECNDTIISNFGDSCLSLEKTQILFIPDCFKFIENFKNYFNITILYEGPFRYEHGNPIEFILFKFLQQKCEYISFPKLNNKDKLDWNNLFLLLDIKNNDKKELLSVYNEHIITYNKKIIIDYQKNKSNLIEIGENIIEFLYLKKDKSIPKIKLMDSLAKQNVEKYKKRISLPINISNNKKYTIHPNIKYNDKLVVLDMDNTLLFRHKNGFILRPYLEKFIEVLEEMKFDIVIWTAAQEIHAKPVLDSIEYLSDKHKIYNDSCDLINNMYCKDLTKINYPLEKIIIVDDRELFYRLQSRNGYKISPFNGHHSKDDNELLKLIGIFKEIKEANSIYHVLDYYSL
jgi:NLI interacting factor-like phosphatase